MDGAEPNAHLGELSYHLFQAAPRGDVELVLDYSLRAASQSSALLAYEDAELHYIRVLQLLDLLPTDNASRRCDVLLALGETYVRSGSSTQARLSFIHAAALARRRANAERLARAALGLAGTVVTSGVVDDQVVALLTEALGCSASSRWSTAGRAPRCVKQRAMANAS